MKRSILFVCTGNVCRSPMAAALFAAEAKRLGDADLYEVSSAGTWALEDEPASANGCEVMQRRGLSLDGHQARTVTGEMLAAADLVLVMTRHHRDSLRAEFPATHAKIHLLSELVGQLYDVGDPYGASLDAYEVCAADLSKLLQRGYPRIVEWIALSAIRESTQEGGSA